MGRHAWQTASGLLAALAAVGGCTRSVDATRTPPAKTAQAALPFEDVTPSSGVDWEAHSARGPETTILDTIGHGVAMLDYDGDDLPDLVLLGKDQVGVFHNLGGFRFERVDPGLRQEGRWGGAAVADVDNNGWPDLYLTGYGCAALYLNDHGRFREVTPAAGLQPPGGKYPAWGASAGFADLDGDGWADLVVCYYLDFGPGSPQRCPASVGPAASVCAPKVYDVQKPRVYRNLRGRRFQDVTAAWGFAGHGAALGVAFQDLNGDGIPDVAIANDERPGDLFLSGGGRFKEAGSESGTALDRQGRVHGGMGLDWGDVDGDGLPDLAVTTFILEDKELYRNLGDGSFESIASRWGLTGPTRGDVAFGVRLLDWDNDGDPDLIIANGHIQENAHDIRAETTYPQPLRLFENAGAALRGLPVPPAFNLVGRALAAGDLDNDGGVDAVLTNAEGRPLLLRNTARRGHWLGVKLEGARGNRMALGARVAVEVSGKRRAFEIHTAGSYMAANDARLLVGLGPATAVGRVTVRWPGGREAAYSAPRTDRWVTLHEKP